MRGTLGLASSLSFRDLGVSEETAPWASFTVSHRGFSVNAWGSVGRESGRYASEAFAAYSHKLPLVDLHLGLAHVLVPDIREDSPVSARLALSSNTSTSTTVDFTADRFLDEPETLYSGAVTVALVERTCWLIDTRLGATYWDRSDLEASAWSIRLLVAFRPVRGPRATGFLGYVDGRQKEALSGRFEDGLVGGLSLAFR